MSEATPQAEPKYTREKVEAELTSKAWRDPAFLEELRTNPKAVIAKEYGLQLPDSVELKVVEETPNTIYLRIPPTSVTWNCLMNSSKWRLVANL